jgi:hypothetical protein
MFKTVDQKFKEIGFEKNYENRLRVTYSRYCKKYKYTQRLELLYKASGRHIVQSYDPSLCDRKNIGNTCVGLSMYEMKLCLKKMKQMGWEMVKR